MTDGKKMDADSRPSKTPEKPHAKEAGKISLDRLMSEQGISAASRVYIGLWTSKSKPDNP
jgi:hypothetical protein